MRRSSERSRSLVLIAATKPGAEKHEYKERYLFALIALAPIAYGFYVRNARPLRAVVIGAAACIAVAAARLPLTEYATATFKTDSQFLFAVSDSQDRFGAANTSLVIALLATFAAVAAIALAFRGNPAIAIAAPLAVALTASVVATHVDIRLTRASRARLPADLSWVDHAARGPVTAIETPQTLKEDLLQQLYWNTSIDREVLLGSATRDRRIQRTTPSDPHERRTRRRSGRCSLPRLRRNGGLRERATRGERGPLHALADERCSTTAFCRPRSFLGCLARRGGPDQSLAVGRRGRSSHLVSPFPPAGPGAYRFLA